MAPEIERIDLWRSGAVGDFVLTLPAVHTLRRAFPQARLRLIGTPRIVRLAGADAILDHNSASLASLFAPEGPIAAATRALFADTDLLLAYSADTEGLLARRLAQAVPGRVLLHNPRPEPQRRRSMAEHLLTPVEQWHPRAAQRRPRLAPTAAGLAYADGLGLPERPIVVHPGSGGADKCWPWARFAALVEALQQRGWSVAGLRGPADSQAPLPCPVFYPPDLLTMSGLLDRCWLFIGNDSGPGHIAAALGRPTLTLFGPTDPLVWAPAGPKARYIQAPSGDLHQLPLDRVLQAALALLAPSP